MISYMIHMLACSHVGVFTSSHVHMLVCLFSSEWCGRSFSHGAFVLPSDWVDLSLDPETAYPKLELSEENKAVKMTETDHHHDINPKRFLSVPQVLCREAVSGQQYWEIDWVGTQGVGIALSYASIRRSGTDNESRFGRNTKSWSLEDRVQRVLLHDDQETSVSSYYNRVGVYLDSEAGVLNFYSVTPDLGDMTLLYQTPRSQTGFTEALYPGFWICDDSYMIICPKKLAAS